MNELLLDTSYLLPVFGIRLELRDFEKAFPNVLRKYSVIYNPASLVEAKWIVQKLRKENHNAGEGLLQAYRSGLRALASEPRLRQSILTDEMVEQIADRLLLKENLRDYFARLVYATATRNDYLLLTEDRELHHVAKRSHARPKKIMNWNELLSTLS